MEEREKKKIIVFAVVCAVLEIVLFASWIWISIAGKDEPASVREETRAETASTETAPTLTVPTETAATEAEQPEQEDSIRSGKRVSDGFSIGWLYRKRLEETIPTTAAEETLPEETIPEETIPEETVPPKVTIDTIPQYFQTDYADVRYGTGTIATSGCNMTCLAMVATYMTDHVYYPDEIADYAADFIGNHVERMDYACDLLQLSWKRAGNFHDAMNAMREGKVVVSVMNSKSLFTTGQHFIVWTGMTENGLILVNDPNPDNYSAWNLKEGFEIGFREGLLLAGYSGAWIFDKSAMPEEPFIYEPVPYAEECRYPGLELTQEEMDLIAKLICAEGESEPFEGQQAIAEVILNRLYSGNFQSSIRNIIYAEGQFEGASQMYKAEPTYTQYKAIERALYGPYVVPIDVVFFAKFAVNKNVWGKIGVHTFCYSY